MHRVVHEEEERHVPETEERLGQCREERRHGAQGEPEEAIPEGRERRGKRELEHRAVSSRGLAGRDFLLEPYGASYDGGRRVEMTVEQLEVPPSGGHAVLLVPVEIRKRGCYCRREADVLHAARIP